MHLHDYTDFESQEITYLLNSLTKWDILNCAYFKGSVYPCEKIYEIQGKFAFHESLIFAPFLFAGLIFWQIFQKELMDK